MARKAYSDVSKGKPGKPGIYETKILPKMTVIKRMAMDGCSIAQIVDTLNISSVAFYECLKAYPLFKQRLTYYKDHADSKVQLSLYKRATGYEHTETDIEETIGENGLTLKTVKRKKHIPAHVGAAQYWMQVRKGGNWRLKQQMETEIKINIDSQDEHLG